MFKLCVGNVEWLFDGDRALRRARFAGHILMRRLGVKCGVILPYGGMNAEPLYLRVAKRSN